MKEKYDKQLLNLEIFIGILITTILFICIFIVSQINIKEIYKVLLIIISLIPFIIGCTICLKIEQMAGYYQCKKCKNKYIPTYCKVFWAPHILRTRYMKCPKCHKYSWNKKVISKDN